GGEGGLKSQACNQLEHRSGGFAFQFKFVEIARNLIIDGVELQLGDFGPDYPEGLLVAQDGNNAPAAQNFKLVGWREIRMALGL
ncbi:MAG: phytase, partial [Sphingopyxis sp.]|nr:phytase [Sphingopyxis sp.]